MAGGPTTTPAQRVRASFVRDLAAKTGLDPLVVQAWVLAEGGPADNPLNIRRADGGFGGFGSVSQAVDATTKFLQGSNYTAVRLAAKSGDAKSQLAAIVASPWEQYHYRGLDSHGQPIMSNPPGASLYGAYQRVKGAPGLSFSAGDVAGHIPGVKQVGDVVGAVTDIPGAIGGAVSNVEGFLVDKALIALGYLVLSVGALALILLGLMRATAPTRAAMASSSAAGDGGRNAAAWNRFMTTAPE